MACFANSTQLRNWTFQTRAALDERRASAYMASVRLLLSPAHAAYVYPQRNLDFPCQKAKSMGRHYILGNASLVPEYGFWSSTIALCSFLMYQQETSTTCLFFLFESLDPNF